MAELEFTSQAERTSSPAPPPATPRPVAAKARFESEPLGGTNLSAIVPETGEPWARWFSRRFEQAQVAFPDLAAHLLIDLATQPIAQKEFDSVLSMLRVYRHEAPVELQTLLGEVEDTFGHAERAAASQRNIAAEERRKREGVRRLGGRLATATAAQVISEEVAREGSNIGSVLAQTGLTALSQLGTGVEVTSKAAAVPAQFIAAGVTGQALPSPEQAVNRALKVGIGRSVAQSAGLQPDTDAYRVVSATVDLVAMWFLDPLVIGGKAAAGARLASRVPVAAGQTAKDLGVRGFWARRTFDHLSKTPEQILDEKPARKGIEGLGRAVERGDNLNQLIDEWRLPVEIAEDILATGGDRATVREVVLRGLKGEAPSKSRAQLEGELAAVKAERLGIQERLGDEVASSPRWRYLAEQERILASRLASTPRPTILRVVPEDTVGRKLRSALKRSDNALVQKVAGPGRGLRKRSLVLPSGGIPIFDREVGRVQIQRVAELMRLPQSEVDVHVNRFLAAKHREEAFQAYVDLLKAGADNLAGTGVNAQVADEMTRMFDRIGSSLFYVDDAGEKQFFKIALKDGRRFKQALPHLDSELAEHLPLPDVEAIRQAFTVVGRVLGGVEKVSVKAGVPALGAGVTQTVRGVDRVITDVMSWLWKPAVLLRVGWPAKIVTEEQIRLAAHGIPSAFNHPLKWMKAVRLARMLDDIPEDALARFGRDLIDRRPAKFILTRGDKGYHEAFHAELVQLNNSRIARYAAGHTHAETVEWLTKGAGRKYADLMRPILDDAEVDWDEYVLTVQRRIAEKARTPELRKAIASGRLDVGGTRVFLSDEAAVRHLQKLDAEALPTTVKALHEDVAVYNDHRVIRRLFDIFGSKPTNTLSRAPAWLHVYTSERKRLRALLGKEASEELIEESARDYATQRVRAILFDASDRTSFQRGVRNLAPFMSAYEEVLERWAFHIPTAIGGGGWTGWATGAVIMQRRLEALRTYTLETGILHKNPEDEWVVSVPGFEQLLRLLPGMEDVKAEIPLKRLNILGTWPALGPVPLTIISQFAKGSDALEDFFDVILPFGPESTTGPVWLNRAFMAGTGGHAPPWEYLSREYQETLWDGAMVDWMRREEAKNGRLSSIAAVTDPAQRRKALDEFVADAKSGTRTYFASRALLGFLLPAQPQFYWPSEREMLDFRRKLVGASSTDYKNAVDELLEDRPGLGAYFTPKSMRLKGDRPREVSRDSYWRDWRRKNIKRFSAEEWSEVAVGYTLYGQIRRDAKEKMEALGPSAKNWLERADEYLDINADRRLRTAQLLDAKSEDGGLPLFKQVFLKEIGAKPTDKPLPDFEENLAMEFANNVRNLSALLRGKEEVDVDWGSLNHARRAISEHFRTERFYSEKELQPGPERDVAEYWERHFGPYMDKMSALFDQARGKTAEQQSELYERARRLADEMPAPVIGGETYPKPDEVLYRMQPPAERAQTRTKWALRPPEWLSSFQRRTLGLSDDPESIRFWNSVNSARQKVRAYIDEQRWIPQQKEARNLRTRLLEWERSLASAFGLENEYALSKEPAYVRLQTLRVADGKTWDTAFQAATTIRRFFAAQDFGPFSKAGNVYTQQFYDWLEDRRKRIPAFNRDLERIWGFSPHNRDGKPSGSAERFYGWFFFGRGF